jgi:hypothetical protein
MFIALLTIQQTNKPTKLVALSDPESNPPDDI